MGAVLSAYLLQDTVSEWWSWREWFCCFYEFFHGFSHLLNKLEERLAHAGLCKGHRGGMRFLQ